jgi:hypothetical protein
MRHIRDARAEDRRGGPPLLHSWEMSFEGTPLVKHLAEIMPLRRFEYFSGRLPVRPPDCYLRLWTHPPAERHQTDIFRPSTCHVTRTC